MKKKLKKKEIPNGNSGIKPFLLVWGLIVSAFLNIALGTITFILNNCYQHAKQESERIERAYNIPPKISFKFEYKGRDSSFFKLKYLGPSELDDFWIEEKIYLVVDTTVYECPEVPRLQYYQYGGSMRSMGTLQPNTERVFRLSECWYNVLYQLKSKHEGQLISRFKMRGSSFNSPEYEQESFFEIDLEHGDFLPLLERESGSRVHSLILRYSSEGPRTELKWDGLTKNFELDPPEWYYSWGGKNWLPWHGEGSPVGKVGDQAKKGIPFTPYSFEQVPGQSVKLGWKCDSAGMFPQLLIYKEK